MEIIPYGDRALLVNFEQKFDEGINREVHQLSDLLEKKKGVLCIIPAFCSLTVVFDPRLTGFDTLGKFIRSCNLSSEKNKTSRQLKIPVCYDKKFGIDLEDIARGIGISVQEIINIHKGTEYRVFMMGFVPGFPYMGILPEQLGMGRRPVPRKLVPMGSVAIANRQTGIYPSQTPGGWNIIGRTPLPLVKPLPTDGFLFENNDRVGFYEINVKEFNGITSDINKGTFKLESIYDY